MSRHRGAGLRALPYVLLSVWVGVGAAAQIVSSTGTEPLVFTDITETAGLTFDHYNAATDEKYIVETMGAGGILFDFDSDSDLDIYFLNGAPLPGSALPTNEPRNALFRNDGMGEFTDVTQLAGVGDRGYGMGAASADIDNDGDMDLYVTNFGPNVFYLNQGDGTFLERTRQVGLSEPGWSTSAAFGDYDADGNIDLYVARYVDFSLERNKFCGNLAKNIKAYCHPDVYDPVPGILFHSDGRGHFDDVSTDSGTQPAGEGKSLGVVWGDYDNDRDLDLYVANDSMRNFLFANRGEGATPRFEDVTLLAGVGYSENGQTQAGMGTDMADVDRDGWQDITVTNLDFEYNNLYRGSESGGFVDDAYGAGIAQQSLNYVGFGTFFFDFDFDGWLDLFVANGHIIDNIHLFNNVSTYRERNFLFQNKGSGRFEEIGMALGPAMTIDNVARGAMPGDVDSDGDLDVLVTRCGAAPLLLRNDGAKGRSIALRLVGRHANRDAVGARAVVEYAGNRQFAEVKTGRSYLSQGELTLRFGLGDERQADVELIWPDGSEQKLGRLAVGEYLVVEHQPPRLAGHDLPEAAPGAPR